MEYIKIKPQEGVVKHFHQLLRYEERSEEDEAEFIFQIGMKQRLKEITIEKYRNKEITLEKAAEIANISVWEMAELLEEKGIPYNLDVDAVIESVNK
ncbi:MAG: hypothetical protein A7316_08525 [Candidatus Altiarchaeales archaeon WOR_SM1_86-2]|nr:MAG: hypothetical protein A7316_08525 [Candidatus Altiarchaeales archaeon WOR_SM1_86-2]ODS41653.1 MAG: hypothetical protein A7315_00855 [Candidatus Altiarchaeales archaeon WOR_SM1_79]